MLLNTCAKLFIYNVTLISHYKRKVIGRFEQVFETWIPFRKPQYPPLRFRDKVAKYWRNYGENPAAYFHFAAHPWGNEEKQAILIEATVWNMYAARRDICQKSIGNKNEGTNARVSFETFERKASTLKDESKDDLAVPEWLSRLKRRHLWNDIPESCHFRDNCFFRDERT